jgi:hypothetical protein
LAHIFQYPNSPSLGLDCICFSNTETIQYCLFAPQLLIFLLHYESGQAVIAALQEKDKKIIEKSHNIHNIGRMS